jgi:HPt (histidine-containing phosphotransfer) domain-containing protein
MDAGGWTSCAPVRELVPEGADRRSVGALDPEAIARLRRLGGDDLAGTLAAMFLDLAPRRLEAARAGLASGDADAVRRAAHSLKSSAGNVGAFAVLEAADRLEAAAEKGTGATMLEPLLEALSTAYAVASAELEVLAGSRGRSHG